MSKRVCESRKSFCTLILWCYFYCCFLGLLESPLIWEQNCAPTGDRALHKVIVSNVLPLSN